MRPILFLVVLCCIGCGSPRKWYIDDVERRPHVAVAEVGEVEFLILKQRDDYLRAAFTVHNQSTATVHFAPPGPGDQAWGIVLRPSVQTTAIRQSGGYESSVIIPPGGTAGFDLLWELTPAAQSDDWGWSIELHGLMVGDKRLPPVVIPVPAYIPPYDPGLNHAGKGPGK